MKFIILGAGAVGGYFGGRLAHAGVDVSFFVREKRADSLRSRGLTVHSVHGDFSIQPKVITTVDEVDKPDVVLVALKNYQLDSAMSALSEFVHKGAVVLPLLNGVEHIEKLVTAFGNEHVLGGTCFIEVTLNNLGDVVQTSKIHDVTYGALSQLDPDWLNQLNEELCRGAFNVRLSEKIQYDMWQKFLFLTSFSGITAAIRQPIGVALSDSQTNEFLNGLISEGCQVARAEGIVISNEFEQTLVERFQRLEPAMTSSLHRDMMKQLPMELDSLHGSMLRMAGNHGIQTPCFKAVYQLLSPYKDGGLSALSLG